MHVGSADLGKATTGGNVALCTLNPTLNGRADYVLLADYPRENHTYGCN